MWRLGFDTPVHYNDHQLYCGGFSRQWVQNKGRCGECGDAWDLPRPRPQEAGGHWGTGLLSRVYQRGQVLTATIHLTANHLGWFEFRLCATNDPLRYAKQRCLNKHVLDLVDHPGTRYQIEHGNTGLFRVRLHLPPDLTCSHCVIQWHYTTGNHWGRCRGVSEGRNGCGPQEVFRGCSDIAIYNPGDSHLLLYHNLTTPPDLTNLLHLPDEPWPPPDHHQDNEQSLEGHMSDLVDPLDDDDDDDDDDMKFIPQRLLPTDPPNNNHLITIETEGSQSHLSSNPTLAFLNNLLSAERGRVLASRTPNSLSRTQALISQSLVKEQQNSVNNVPSSSGRKYVSSDAFRGILQDNRVRQVSAPTAFLTQDISDSPLVLTPHTLGVTPSPLGPPQVLPFPRRSQQPPRTPGGLRSVNSFGSSVAFRPTQEVNQGTTRVNQETSSKEEEAEVARLESELGSDRLRLLQRALTLATSASQGDHPPIVLILM
ncbi:hypothetical protein Pmani_025040 [Petrolisthes manimaculis]|uniref:Chitin-binding type-4 domain-containing protein n=1 Tax=Petrolisthes manimaculis TaxID=1843537 RepID=A0AAE1TY40_9EUCA|nr:hypothetical protein Pmani_025040 [Petrolisthes manimaculis]